MKPKREKSFRKGLLTVAISMSLLAAAYLWFSHWSAKGVVTSIFPKIRVAFAESKGESAASVNAFLKAYPVFMDPRCVNCHPMGDHPLQGNNSRPHAMDVKRGPEGVGKNGLWCVTCHQSEGLPGPHMPPSAPGWELPPEDTPMVFENQSPRKLCEHLKDPAQNGGRSPEEVVDHVQEAPLVLWGWNPGEGRTPVPMPHQEFVKTMREWAQKGAACPE
jgi:hypothetical protein